MSDFWSGWVIALLTLNFALVLFLFVWGQIVRIPSEFDGTTGHAWAHGVLREAVRKLPWWWVLLSALAMIAAFTYLVLYPGFGNYKGVLQWTSADELRREAAINDAKLAALHRRLSSLSLEQLTTDSDATSVGHRLYLDNCAACHGTEARGNHVIGAPNLIDSEWSYGGNPNTMLASILDGRIGVMPPWGSALGHDGVNEVTSYVLSLSGVHGPEDWTAAGKARFDAMCVSCHGTDARGNQALGAPNLTDEVWLYGGDFASIAKSIRDGRNGVMPAWRQRLSDSEVRTIVAWVISQGHGRPTSAIHQSASD